MIDTSLFPHENHPYRLEFGEKKNSTICWFECQEHLDKYLERYRLDKRTIKLDYRDGEPIVVSKKHKAGLEQKPGAKRNGSVSPVRKRKPSVDPSGNPAGTTKRKK